MSIDNKPSPFHIGELAVQRRVGVDEKIEQIGRRVFRDHLLQQHRDFYASQHQLLLATVDSQARPWATMVAGPAGFAYALSETQLRIDAFPVIVSDQHQLAVGDVLGVLGIDYASRRRNRVNGRIASIDSTGFVLQVDSSFGNCPKYIQTRHTILPTGEHWRVDPTQGELIEANSAKLRAVVTQADHFYIATHYQQAEDMAHQGADISHRGGKAGFIKMDEAGSLLFPDFAGNRFYNTLGNIEMNGKAALLFIDFDSGSLFSMTGTATVGWQAAQQSGFAGAERMLRWQAQQVWYYPQALPFRWQFGEFSPALAATGAW